MFGHTGHTHHEPWLKIHQNTHIPHMNQRKNCSISGLKIIPECCGRHGALAAELFEHFERWGAAGRQPHGPRVARVFTQDWWLMWIHYKHIGWWSKWTFSYIIIYIYVNKIYEVYKVYQKYKVYQVCKVYQSYKTYNILFRCLKPRLTNRSFSRGSKPHTRGWIWWRLKLLIGRFHHQNLEFNGF